MVVAEDERLARLAADRKARLTGQPTTPSWALAAQSNPMSMPGGMGLTPGRSSGGGAGGGGGGGGGRAHGAVAAPSSSFLKILASTSGTLATAVSGDRGKRGGAASVAQAYAPSAGAAAASALGSSGSGVAGTVAGQVSVCARDGYFDSLLLALLSGMCLCVLFVL